MGLDPYIPANTPAQFLEALVERCKSVLTFGVVRSPVHEDTNPPNRFVAKEVQKWSKVVEFSGAKIKAE